MRSTGACGANNVNFVAHLLVALDHRAGEPTSDFAFGAVLPDLASMGRLKFDRASLSPEALLGVKLHHATDDAFHSNKWFTSLLGEGVAQLMAEQVPRGAARACAHLGVELLLDGVLLEDKQTSKATNALFASLNTQIAASPDNTAWPQLLKRAADYGPPNWYGEPQGVAAFLQRVTSERPRLAFGVEHLAPVEDWLTEVRPAIAADSLSIVEHIARSVADS